MLAAITDHNIDLLVVLVGVGFCVGVWGHITGSRWVVLAGIAVVLSVSLYLVAAGEIQTLGR